MKNTIALSLLALAGAAFAAPAPHRRQGNVVYKTVVHTRVVTHVGGKPSEPTPQPEPAPVEAPVVVTPTPEPQPETTPTPVVEEQEAPKPTETKASTSTGYMGIVDEWRGKLGLSQLTQDGKLEANALKTAQDGNGQMVHQLNDGSKAQVLAPGQPDEFYKVFVGGWLCERPDMNGMDGVCSSASSGWYYTSTGHADILTSPDYSKIGCAQAGGIWSCDLA